MLAKRALAPPTIPELIALTVALGAYAVMTSPPPTAPPIQSIQNWAMDNVAHGEEADATWTGSLPAGTNTIGKVNGDVTTVGGAPSSGTNWYPNQGDKWLDCSMARETSQCVPRDFPEP